MNNKYRVNWQAGMRLTDATFRTADEYQIFRQRPIYALLATGGYGFLEAPVVRYEVSDTSVSFIEIQADAICHSGKYISLHYHREQRALFQGITMPDTTSPVIAYIDITSNKTIKVADSEEGVPLCDDDYRVIMKLESEHYSNPDAVPFARFVYNHGWGMDTAFIAPCLTLRANGALLRAANEYCTELNNLINALRSASNSAQSIMVHTLIPVLSVLSVEVDKEANAMTPAHFVAIMQRGIQAILSAVEIEYGIFVPEHQYCKSYVESYYSPYNTSYMVSEGIRLTKALVEIPKTFTAAIVVPSTPLNPPSDHPIPPRPHGGTNSERYDRRGKGFGK